MRPNGSTGWIRTADVTVAPTTFHIGVELGARRDHRDRLRDGHVPGPGRGRRARHADPVGDYYLRVLLQAPDPDTAYGPYAYGLSSHSDSLDTFNGGDAEIGIHGNDDASVLGTDITHGCVRDGQRRHHRSSRRSSPSARPSTSSPGARRARYIRPEVGGNPGRMGSALSSGGTDLRSNGTFRRAYRVLILDGGERRADLQVRGARHHVVSTEGTAVTALATPLVTEDAASGTEATAAPIEMRIDLSVDGTVDGVVHAAVDWAEIVPLRSPCAEVLGRSEVDSSRVDVGSTSWEPGDGMSVAATAAAATAAEATADDDIAVLHSDEERFSDLVRRHHRRFARLAFVLCGDHEQAEDAVADAFTACGRSTEQRARGRPRRLHPRRGGRARSAAASDAELLERHEESRRPGQLARGRAARGVWSTTATSWARRCSGSRPHSGLSSCSASSRTSAKTSSPRSSA